MPLCPRCGQPLRRLDSVDGSFFMTCPNRVAVMRDGELRPREPRQGERRSDHCGQTVHVVSMGGIAWVTPISKESFARYHRTYPTVAKVYGDLGIVVPSRPIAGEEEIPKHKCKGCGTLTPLFDLYGGRCRQRCAKLAPHVESA